MDCKLIFNEKYHELKNIYRQDEYISDHFGLLTDIYV